MKTITYHDADRLLYLDLRPGSNPAAASESEVVLDLEERAVYAATDTTAHGTPLDIWHGRRLVLPAGRDCNAICDAAATVAMLRDEYGSDVEAVCDGYTCEWDGNNHLGRLDDDATAALWRIQDALDHAPTLPDNACVCDIWDLVIHSADLLDWCADLGHPITADTDEAALVAATAAIEEAALAELRLLSGVYTALRDLRDEKRVQREEDADA